MREESGRGRCSSLRGIFPPRMTLARARRGQPDVDIGDFFFPSGLDSRANHARKIRKPLTDRLHDQGWTTTGNPVVPELFQYFEMSNTNDDRVRTGWQFHPAIFHLPYQSPVSPWSLVKRDLLPLSFSSVPVDIIFSVARLQSPARALRLRNWSRKRDRERISPSHLSSARQSELVMSAMTEKPCLL